MTRIAMIASLAGAVVLGLSTLSAQAAPRVVSHGGIHAGKSSLVELVRHRHVRHHHFYRHYR